MRRLYLICGILAVILGALTLYYRDEPDTFYGIADTKEITISSGSAVEIRRIAVAQGQMVAQGDTLIELHNPELDLRLSQISHELSELRARKAAHASLSKSEILQLKAQQEERTSEIRAELKELEAQYEMNKRLVSELHSLDRDKANAGNAGDAGNPILIKIESLRKLLELSQDPSRVYENRLANALSSDGDPLAEQVIRLEDELRILNGDRTRLAITAQIGGLIGSVNFKAGEKVSPFAPILTLHAASPSFVRGYIHEDVYSQVAVKQKVRVQSNQDRRHKVEGEVIGVGARIVEYPERLRRRAEILIWGREIIIRLPAENRFLLGEKVLISLPGSLSLPGARRPDASLGGQNGATPAPAFAEAPVLRDIRPLSVSAAGLAPAAPAEVPGIEASGLIYLPDLARFLVISDDTPRKQAQVYLMDTAFRIEKTVPIRGLDGMDDMEAIAEGANGRVWILSSQSRSKGGKLKPDRKLLVKALRKGGALELEGKMSLLDRLDSLSRVRKDLDWAAWLQEGLAAGTVDIEGLAVKDGDLYFGFKAPLRNGKAVILRVAGADAFLAGGPGPGADAVFLWKSLDLKDTRTGIACGVADLIFMGGDAWILSTGDAKGKATEGEGHAGALWRLRGDEELPVELKDFGGAKPEGLARHDTNLYIAFDNGSKSPSQVMRLEAPK